MANNNTENNSWPENVIRHKNTNKPNPLGIHPDTFAQCDLYVLRLEIPPNRIGVVVTPISLRSLRRGQQTPISAFERTAGPGPSVQATCEDHLKCSTLEEYLSATARHAKVNP